MSRAPALVLIPLAIAALASPASAGDAPFQPGAPPSLSSLLFAAESAAEAEGPASLRFNPAIAGLRYPSEFAFSVWTPHGERDQYRGALALGGFTIASSGAENRRLETDLGLAGGGTAFRFGVQYASLPRTGGHTGDWRLGALSRPSPWLSVGAVVDHLGQPRLDGGALDRTWTLGVGFRPFALSPAAAHRLGPRLTLTADASMREGDSADEAATRFGADLEVVPGLAIRGRWFAGGGGTERGYQLGLALLGLRSAYHGQSGYSDGGTRRYMAHSVSFHQGEDRTVFVPPSERRVAVVRLAGALGDDAVNGFGVMGGGESAVPVEPVHRALERALRDPLTRGVFLDLRGVSNMAQIEELRPRIAKLRAAGKPVVAYLEIGMSRPDLYLAAACDRIVMPPLAFSRGLGLRYERRYYRKLLDQWGVRIDRASYGKYKSAYRNYSVDSSSVADRESIENQLDRAQDLFVSAIAADRHLEHAALLRMLDGRQWTAAQFRDEGIIDSVGYRDDALALLGAMTGLGRRPPAVALSKHPEAERDWMRPTRIAVVYASGAIETGQSGNDLLFGPYMGATTLMRQIERAFRRPDVKAVVLRVESPGGSSLGSDLIRHALERMKRETHKPLIVSMGSVAASGGYHIALPADRIYADRHTRTGSIGVLYVKPSFQAFYAKHDVRQEAYERGALMRGWSQNVDWDAQTQAIADSIIYAEYHDFVKEVADARGMTWEETNESAQGRVWFADDALKRGLVDEIGGLDAALAEARRRAGIPADEKLEVAEYRRPRPGLLGRLAGAWVAEQWERTMRMPDPGVYWLDDDLLSR